MLRKVGLRMKPFLLLDRRGVFDGTVENMHLHWKYRELVKILSGEKSVDEVHAIARTLEAESGGILVAVERVSKGHAIIVYPGKNYKCPASLRPQTLLNKREALKRSIEAQCRESLKLHVLKLSRNVGDLKLKLEMKKGQSAEYMGHDSDFETCKPSPASDQENVQATESHGGDSIIFSTNGGMEASRYSLETNCQDVSADLSMEFEGRDSVELGTTELQADSLRDSVQAGQGDVLNIPSITYADKDGTEHDKPDSKALSELLKGTDVFMETDSESAEAECTSTSKHDDFMSQGQKNYSNIPNAEPHISVTTNEGAIY